MSNTVEHLRDIAANHGWLVCDEAADEIERLTADLAAERLYSKQAGYSAGLKRAAGAAPAIPPGYVKASEVIDARGIYATLCDLWAEANAVDTVMGRPQVLLSKITKLRDEVGSAVNCYIPKGAAPRESVARPSTPSEQCWQQRQRSNHEN